MREGQSSGAPPAGPDEEHAQPGAASVAVWRRRMLERVMWSVWLALTLALALVVNEALAEHMLGRASLLAAAWVMVGLSAWLRRFDLRVRGVGLFLGMVVASVGTFAYGGFQAPNGFLGMLMVVVLLALGFGPRAAWWALGASALAVIATAYLFVTTGYDLPDPALQDVHLPGNWVRVIAIFLAVAGGTLVCVSYMTSKLESAILRSQELLDALAAESQQRLDALDRQRSLFQQLQQAQKLESIGTLAGGVAHDFNNLLLVILSHVDLLQRRGVGAPSENAASVRAIEESARRATDLTRQLLAFSRRQVAGHERFELEDAAERSLGLIRRLLPASIELRFTPGHEPTAVWGAAIELDQVVMNLCVNARDAMPEGGLIEVTTARVVRKNDAGKDTEYACLSVRDTGTGILPEQQARIFDPFFTTKPPDRGTGLGLSVVHELVQQWGGFIEVDSTPGVGTTMRVYLPRSERTAGAASSDAAPIGALRGRETVMIVDDEPRVRAVTEAILLDAGYRVIACADGAEALRRFRAAPTEIDLLITDAVMPRMGGRELHDAISLDYPDLPCVICSGYAPDTVTAGFSLPGRREFLQKPFTPEQLLANARRLLDFAKQSESADSDDALAIAPPRREKA
jgi:signal transduction histidine kinase